MTETTRGAAASPVDGRVDGPVDGRVSVADTAALHTVADVVDQVGNASYEGVGWVRRPADRLPNAFLRLRTGFAGEVTQKFVSYRIGVRESDAGSQVWFLPDLDALEGTLDR